MKRSTHTLRSLLLSATLLAAAAFAPATHARATLNACAGGVSSGFQQACEGHAGYFAINLKLSGDGGCLEMCCTGDASSGYACVSDPNAIRRVTALWVGPQLSVITASKEGTVAPAPSGVVISVSIAPDAVK
ncbi:MAG: hypothetical protein U1F05_13635 [Burkholderiales bacterium]